MPMCHREEEVGLATSATDVDARRVRWTEVAIPRYNYSRSEALCFPLLVIVPGRPVIRPTGSFRRVLRTRLLTMPLQSCESVLPSRRHRPKYVVTERTARTGSDILRQSSPFSARHPLRPPRSLSSSFSRSLRSRTPSKTIGDRCSTRRSTTRLRRSSATGGM